MLVDANVFLRFLRNDHPQHSAAAKKLIEEAALGSVVLRVAENVVVDIFYALTGPLMKIPRPNAARKLVALLLQPGIDLDGRHRVFEILNICEKKDIDYGDAALVVAAQSPTRNIPILSYERKFALVPEITTFSPVEWLQKGRKLIRQP
jgi:predicted nucleic acid-binding protein